MTSGQLVDRDGHKPVGIIEDHCDAEGDQRGNR
jgi:hypothetical protein